MSSYQILVGSTGNNSVNKIPEYARDYKKEWLMIRGINMECRKILFGLGVFKINKNNNVEKLIKRFLRAQEYGKFKDISKLELNYNNVFYIKDFGEELKEYEKFLNEDLDSDDFKNIEECKKVLNEFKVIFYKFRDQLNIKHEYDDDKDIHYLFRKILKKHLNDGESVSDSDSDSDNEYEEIGIDELLNEGVSDSDSDSDSDNEYEEISIDDLLN